MRGPPGRLIHELGQLIQNLFVTGGENSAKNIIWLDCYVFSSFSRSME